MRLNVWVPDFKSMTMLRPLDIQAACASFYNQTNETIQLSNILQQ